MRFIKLALISVFFFAVILLLISLLMPSHISISRVQAMNANKEDVSVYLSTLVNWKEWNVLVADSALENPVYTTREIRSDKLIVGLIVAENDTIRTRWTTNGRHVQSDVYLMQKEPHTLIVQWNFDVRFSWYPWERLSSTAIERQLGPLLESSLDNLKNIAERSP